MYIDKIEISNFRVYYGFNQLQLSKDSTANISVVAGNNGFGKTSFLTSLVWALYGKIMSDVDQRYKQEIYEAGGYKKYCHKLMNRVALKESELQHDNLPIALGEDSFHLGKENTSSAIDITNSFSVTIRLSGVMIPSVQSEFVQIKRTYNVKSHKEDVEILIDGKINELTKNVGPEIFINDFILPKEIAKFFFFDAEKIVSLSEIKTTDEKLFLSQAYSEVLGIKKYTDLKNHLENVRLRMRNRAADKSDRTKLNKLTDQLVQNEKLIQVFRQQITEKSEILQSKLNASDRYQEQLIREGSGMTLSELKGLKESQISTNIELVAVKSRFNEMIELAPLAMAAGMMHDVKTQLENEISNSSIANSILKSKADLIVHSIQSQREVNLSPQQQTILIELIRTTLLPADLSSHKVLLDPQPEFQNNFFATYELLRSSYSKNFKSTVADLKRVQSIYNAIQKKLADAESKEKDSVVAAIRKAKTKVDNEIVNLENEIAQLTYQINSTGTDNQTILRQVSELSKKVKVEDADQQKDLISARLIDKLNVFILKFKHKKKESLEQNILIELNRLMHKNGFVKEVKVIIDGEIIEIELFDQLNHKIDKELLSKGEQQLYATALLKALIEESNIRFPVFIDSPLQKFDRKHSQNIINQFYPNIAAQVILFPLIGKELTEVEYRMLLPKVGKAFLINQVDKYQSSFTEVDPENLFDYYLKQNQYV
ncbi:AAA family ATPase [Mucilaginibacter sp. SG564]|uniref:AAA family ATPase n=1 Tax=Mucilaginibacter sp. SG564 TaxID=2587022 RepID=UPI001556D647|nr:AAA family ATPase [Mucilaginibacter sp. SG564]NOW96130.1 DNA sulfur modification protein DndD [Mucilaginibacter sp. SG564]